jgi:outer membrane protein assembly factor BamB/tetratricopeptide (TPR) repeat protein
MNTIGPGFRGRSRSRGDLPAAVSCFGALLIAAPLIFSFADDKPGEKADKPPAAAKPADEKKAGDKKSTPPPANPLTDFLKRSLQPGKSAPAGQMPGMPDNRANKSPVRRPVDPRAPYDKRADDWLRKARKHIEAGEWKEAFELLQRISELPDDTLYRQESGKESGKWTSMRAEAQRLRGEAPPEFLERYRAQFGGLARQLLTEAIHTGDLGAYARIATLYFHTDAGYEAANRLGSLHLDRGELGLAARWFAALWQARPSLTKDSTWRAKSALCLHQAGQTALAREIVETLPPPAVAATAATPIREAVKRLSSPEQTSGPRDPALADWPMFYGTPRRIGVASGGEPLLLPRWRVNTTDSSSVRTQIEHLVDDLADQGTTPIPMLFPVMVDGKVAFRTLHGVQVVDSATGQTLWQTDELQPIERLVAGSGIQSDPGADSGFFPGIVLQRGMRPFGNGFFQNAGIGESSPLSNLLYRNANFGILSSDGHQLFVVDDPAFLTNRQPANPWGWDGTPGQQVSSACRLASYDLETGRPLWEIGGAANGEAFDRPLAGYFLFGAPVADAGELFIVGESTVGETSGQVRLFCLEAQTGVPKWSQLIAGSEVSIEKDVGRRWWTAQVAVADGMLVCPTSVGWLVAVDRLTHSLVWGHPSPLPPRQTSPAFGDNEAQRMVQHTALNGMWGPAPPIVSGGRIIYAPPESQHFVALDLTTGATLWSKPRGNGLYVAGAFDDRVIVIGRESVAAYQLETGNQVWTARTRPPTGRAVAIADRLYVPQSGGIVCSLDLKTGALASQSSLPGRAAAVGNLAMCQGMLLSLDAFGLTAFEQRSAVLQEIARRKQQDPNDPQALLREAEISLLANDLAAARETLQRTSSVSIPEELREPFRTLLIQVLTAAIRADYSRPETDSDLAHLQKAAASPVDRQSVRRLEAEILTARKQFGQAFEALLTLAAEPDMLVTRDDLPAIRVRGDLWAAGKLADLLDDLPAAERPGIDQRIGALAAQTSTSDTARTRFTTLFRNHPLAVSVTRELAENFAARGDFVQAERLLLGLAQRFKPAVAAPALERLARLMAASKLSADAVYFYEELERRFGDAPFRDGLTASQFVQELRESGRLPDLSPGVLDWQTSAIRVERSGTNYSNSATQELTSLGSPVPFFKNHRLQIEQPAQRLEVVDLQSDVSLWSLPLRNRAGFADNNGSPALAAGHHLAVLHGGVLHSLSPVDHRILWTKPLSDRGAGQYSFVRQPNPPQPMQSPANLSSRMGILAAAGASPLSFVTNDLIGIQGHRQVTAFEALTGRECWTYTGVRPGTQVFGGDELVFFRPADGKNPIALRARDGRRVEINGLEEIMNRALVFIGDAPVLWNLKGGQPGLRLFDLVAQRDLWAVEIAKGAQMSALDSERMAVLEPDGKLAVITLRTGRRQSLGQVASTDLAGRSEVFAVADQTALYLVINNQQMRQNFYSEQLPFVRVNGSVLAFDLQAGKQRWKQPVQAQNLLVERMGISPFLIFSSRKYETRGKFSFSSLHLVVIDKISGTKLLDEKSGAQPGLRSITVNASDRFVELRSNAERVRLYPVDKQASAGQSGG